MKKINCFARFCLKKKDYLILFVFYIFCFVLLFSKNYSYQVHIVFLFLAIFPSFSLLKDFSKEKTFKFFILFSFIFWITMFPLINELSFWGDEIGVIDFARHPFSNISALALNGHCAVPPLDYLNLAMWEKVISFTSNDYLEYFLRIPYFFYHSFAAILFAFSVKAVILLDKSNSFFSCFKNKFKIFSKNNDLFILIAFLTYFFNPLLFFYSLEVRFFAFSALGSIVTLYLYLTKRITKIKFLPLTLLFTLNSVFQFLIMMPYLVLVFFEEKNSRKEALFIGVLYFVLGIVLLRNISIPDPVSQELSRELVFNAAKNFFDINFVFLLNFIFFVFVFIFLFLKKPKEALKWLLILLFYFSSISIAALHKRYFDFYVRHYIFVVPILIFVLFRIVPLLKRRQALKYSYLLFLFFTVPWMINSFTGLIKKEVVSKDDIRAKEISNILKNENRNVYIIFGEEDLDYGVYFFYSNTLGWYFDRFGIDYEKVEGNACDKLEFEDVALVSIRKRIDCSNGSDYFDKGGSEVVFSKR